jgi:hypothetical protein
MNARQTACQLVAAVVIAAALGGCGGGGGGTEAAPRPAEVVVGERLFGETRFAQFFAANCGGDVNVQPPPADPVLASTATTTASIPGPLAGATMSCRACHLHLEALTSPIGGLRNFSDFARRSPVPLRPDGVTHTVRNASALVRAVADDVPALHYDGEFATDLELVQATLTGRNYGWLIPERSAAVAHVAKVIREDDGTGPGAETTAGLPYAAILRADAGVPATLVLPPQLRIDPATATDEQILAAVAALIDAFQRQIDFGRGRNGDYARSPYDLFLKQNDLPPRQDAGETGLAYSRRLRAAVGALTNPQFIDKEESIVQIPSVPFEFGPLQLQGLKIFLAEPATSPPSPSEIAQGGIGNCIACHSGPLFTDRLAHDVGASQASYDAIHGDGAFLGLWIPGLVERNANPDLYLPATAAHPFAAGPYRAVPTGADPLATDLGVWNVFANPDFPAAQAALQEMVERAYGIVPGSLGAEALLPLTIGMFRTPGLRSLTIGAPYFHDGEVDFLEQIAEHYASFGAKSRAGIMRNADPAIANVALVNADSVPLAAFMRSMNENLQ